MRPSSWLRPRGIPSDDVRQLLAPLVRRSVENWADAGAQDALTGPIARGDAETVARQRTAAAALDFQDLFDAHRRRHAGDRVSRRSAGTGCREERTGCREKRRRSDPTAPPSPDR